MPQKKKVAAMRPAKTLTKIVKRDGRIVSFDEKKIYNAIEKAFFSVKGEDGAPALAAAKKVIQDLNKKYFDRVPNVEEIQDSIIYFLKQEKFDDVAESYETYRQKRQEIREAKYFLLYQDVRTKLTENALKVLESRYLKKDINGKIIETPQQLFCRVASNIAATEKIYNPGISDEDFFRVEKEFYQMIASLEFMPNSPTIMNAGTSMQQLSACFVLPIEDSMQSIFDAIKATAVVHQSGGGTGYNFGRLRPKNDIVRSTQGVSSGPVSFMRIFDMVAEVVKQGGKRRGAMMGIMPINHPDILQFISAKSKEGILQNFNISVAITEEFIDAVKKGKKYKLINPKNGQTVDEIDAEEVFDTIAKLAWETGDPGIVFIERMNDARGNPVPRLGQIEATNPCGEQPLLPNEPCNLGSINLNRFVEKKGKKLGVNYDKLKKTVWSAVHFLDNVIDMNKYPLQQIEEMAKGNRRIGLGIMGWADLLVSLEVPYNSKKALSLANEVMGFIESESHKASVDIAKKRGTFPNFRDSLFNHPGGEKLRNCAVTTIAPTGTIGIIAGCSQGIEPKFALAYVRKSRIGKGEDEWVELIEVDKQFEEVARKEGFYSEKLMKNVAEKGSVAHVEGVPEKWKKIFVTAHDLYFEDHIKMQVAFQKHVDNAVSKTVNLPNSATVEDVKNAYLMCWDLGCKGTTIYRDGSKMVQVLNVSNNKEQKIEKEKESEAEVVPSPLKHESIIDTNLRTPVEVKDSEPNDLPPGICLTCA